jgi:hypothetical protein
MSELNASITKHYNVEKNGASLELRCKNCSKAWQWPAAKEMNVGTVLHLLNHARSHKESRK